MPTAAPESLAIFGAAAIVWFVVLKRLFWKKLTKPGDKKKQEEMVLEAQRESEAPAYIERLKESGVLNPEEDDYEEAPPPEEKPVEDNKKLERAIEAAMLRKIEQADFTIAGGVSFKGRKVKLFGKEEELTLDTKITQPKLEEFAKPVPTAQPPAKKKPGMNEAEKETGEADLSRPESKILDFSLDKDEEV